MWNEQPRSRRSSAQELELLSRTGTKLPTVGQTKGQLRVGEAPEALYTPLVVH